MTTDSPATTAPIRVAILFGGRSSEHAVSCVTAAGVLGAIDRGKYDVVPIGIAKNGQWVLAGDDLSAWSLKNASLPEVAAGDKTVSLTQFGDTHQLVVTEAAKVPEVLGAVDVVFPLLHGPWGEDGTVQGLLELSDTRYVGAGVLASAIGMDKHFMKVVFDAAGLAVGPYLAVTDREWTVDPAKVRARLDQLDAAIAEAREHDLKLVIEAGIVGREIECAVLEGRGSDVPRVSQPGEIAMVDGEHHAFYDFEAKYVQGDAVSLSCPADMPDADVARIQEQAALAFDAVGAEGLSRVDFFYTAAGELIINEINTMPGFTPSSMYPQMWAASGLAYPELIDELLQLALNRKVGLR